MDKRPSLEEWKEAIRNLPRWSPEVDVTEVERMLAGEDGACAGGAGMSSAMYAVRLRWERRKLAVTEFLWGLVAWAYDRVPDEISGWPRWAVRVVWWAESRVENR